jgi:hypothetical protein
VIVPVDGSGPGLEVPYVGGIDTGTVTDWEWAPDDSSILGRPTSVAGTVQDQILLNPVTGTSRTLPWASVSQPSWQRVAP